MNASDLLQSIGEQIQSASAKKVYGDPISVGDRSVIPVARVRFGFGGGGGGHPAASQKTDEGGGGGGGGQISPVGVVEITPLGTRFIPIRDPGKALVLIAFGLGFLAGRRRRR